MVTFKLPRRLKYFRALYYLRRAIKLPAIEVASTNFDAEVHMLVGKYHLYAAVAALKSFFLHSGLAPRVGVTFHFDPSMRPRHERLLRRHFPGADCLYFGKRDARLDTILNDRPFCRGLYDNHPLAPKLFRVPALCRSNRVILLDTDTLFYRRPDAIVDWVVGGSDTPMYLDEKPGVAPHRALQLAYEALSQQMGFNCEQFCYFNSGLLLFQPERIDYDLIERFLKFQAEQPNIHTGGWCIEQTAYMLNYVRWNDKIRFDTSDYACGTDPGQVFSHFLGSNYYEGRTLAWIRTNLRAFTAFKNNGLALTEKTNKIGIVVGKEKPDYV